MRWIFVVGLALFGPAALAGLLVTEVTGKPTIEGKGVVATLAEIPDGARISVPPGAQLVTVDLGSGREFVLKGGANYVVAPSGPSLADGKAIEAKPLPAKNLPYARDVRIAAGSVAQASMVMRGFRKANVPLLIAPVRTAVTTMAPEFRWNAVDAVTGYRLSVTTSGGTLVWDVATRETEMALPADRHLVPGERYFWRVEALGEAGTISDASAMFWVANADAISRLDQLKPEANAPFGRRVLYAVQLGEAGATAEAKERWKALARERPDDDVIRALAE
jgi:hypothetical protein